MFVLRMVHVSYSVPCGVTHGLIARARPRFAFVRQQHRATRVPADAVARLYHERRVVAKQVADLDLHVAPHAQRLHMQLALAIAYRDRLAAGILFAVDDLGDLTALTHRGIRILRLFGRREWTSS